LIFKGHKLLEYWCLVIIHLTSVSTISYAESNGDIFILIAPLIKQYKYRDKRTASDLSTIQFRLIFKGHKSLEYWCLIIHLTSVSTISYAESNGGIFSLIALLGNTNTRTNVLRVMCQQYRTASNLSIQFRLIFKGHKSLEYWCLVIHLASVSTISYAESNGGIFILIAPLGITNTISYFTLSTLQFSRTVV
jgi:hypothetical protein